MGWPIPLCRWPDPGYAVFPRRKVLITVKQPVTASLRVPPSSGEVTAMPSPPDMPASSSPGLCFPSAHAGLDGPLYAGVACPLRSAFRVWLPSWRFPPVGSGPGLFHPGSARGIHPSELSPLERYPGVSARMNPLTVSPSGSSLRRSGGRPGRPRFLGFHPRESPWRPARG
jgi:hypothetical protein